MAKQTPLELATAIQKLLQTTESNSDSDSKELRLEACGLAIKLFKELEEPGDTVSRVMGQTTEMMVLLAAIEMKVLDSLVQSDGAVSSNDIASQTKADQALVYRILRFLAAHLYVDEIDVDLFKANKSTLVFSMPKSVAGFKYVVDTAVPAWRAIPEYLRKNGYKTPDDPLDAPIQLAFSTRKHFFDIMIERNIMSTFQAFMSDERAGRKELLDIFPADERLIQGFDSSSKDAVFIVDVAGGRGHEIMKLAEKFPQAKGRKILQDLPDVVKEVESTNEMEAMEYDFFTPQPVKGARCYHFRLIYHDWPDSHCLKILKNTTAAMKPGYSRIIINDIVLPNKGVTPWPAASDMAMLALLSSMERSELQWRSLLERAGLKIIKIWPGVPESVIEAELA